LQIGADKAILIKTADNLLPLNKAKVYKILAHQEQANLCFLGANDDNGNALKVAPNLAVLLNYILAFNVTSLEYSLNYLLVESDLDNQKITMSVKYPCVLAFQNYKNTLPKSLHMSKTSVQIIDIQTLPQAFNFSFKVIKRHLVNYDRQATPIALEELPTLISKIVEL
jgi:electron transfer flavoprotein beta subunit